jgi:prohibitin 2
MQNSNFNSKYIGFAAVALLVVIFVMSSYHVVEPGFRGIKITLGSVYPNFLPEGLNFKQPFISRVIEVPVRQLTHEVVAQCYSSDLQPIKATLKVLYRIPEQSVVSIFQKYSGDPMDTLIAPRVQEAFKEVTAAESAEQIVTRRESVKIKALEAARKKIGDILILEDLVVENIDLTDELEKAIELKMVQEQEAAKAKFVKQKAEIEAETALIRATGEAKAISVRGDAIRSNPGIVQLQIVEKWDGKAPLVVGGGSGANILLPLENLKSREK